MQRECTDCLSPFELSSEKSPVTYCKKCRTSRLKDILEVITLDDTSGGIISKYFHDEQAAIAELQLFCANIRLDLHKTLDTISPDQPLSVPKESSVCCISYVGNITLTRTQARLDISNRIKTEQIKFGALVFKRGPHKDPHLSHNFTETGSKHWFNKHLPYVPTEKVIFIDDSKDHTDSVCLLPHVKSILLLPHHNLGDKLGGRLASTSGPPPSPLGARLGLNYSF